MVSVPNTVAWLLLAAPPVKPVPVGIVHAYLVPAGTVPLFPLAGETANATPAQVVAVISVITATGFTVTVTVKSGPLPQALVLGVIV